MTYRDLGKFDHLDKSFI